MTAQITSPTEIVIHLFFEILFGCILVKAIEKGNKWYKSKPEAWRKGFGKKLIYGGVNVLLFAIVSYIAALIIYGGCKLISSQITAFAIQQFADFETPKFSGNVDPDRFGISDVNPRTHMVTFYVKIYNNGAPSIVKGWNLNIRGVTENPLALVFWMISNYFL